jgi:hypothetical protein
MSIRIGGSCGGRYSRPISGITSYENRLLQNNEHKYFWQDLAFCLSNGIYSIINIDTYLTGSRWRPTNPQLRQFVLDTKAKIKSMGANKTNCRFTYDNETDEYTSFDDYMNGVRVIHDALDFDFDLGAGNFRTVRKDWYEALAKLSYQRSYEVFDFHMQDGLDDVDDIRFFSDWILYLKNTYKLRLAVTEGNNFYNVSTEKGHSLLKCQINYAENIGCEDFCFVYVNWTANSEEDHEGMSYNVNDRPVTDYWGNMANFIISKKPIANGDDEMKLDKIYKKGSRGIGVKFIQMVVNELLSTNLIVDGIWGSKTEEGVKAFQAKWNLVIDGIVGPATFPAMIEAYPKLWDRLQYMYAVGE